MTTPNDPLPPPLPNPAPSPSPDVPRPAGWSASGCLEGTGRAAFSGGAGPTWVAGLLDPWGGLLLVAVVLAVDVDVVDDDVDFGDL